MRRALMLLNLYGHEALRHKLKNGLKTQKMHFLPVIDFMLDSIMVIKVEPHQRPLHQSIILIQDPFHEIFSKNFLRIGDFEKVIFL